MKIFRSFFPSDAVIHGNGTKRDKDLKNSHVCVTISYENFGMRKFARILPPVNLCYLLITDNWQSMHSAEKTGNDLMFK